MSKTVLGLVVVGLVVSGCTSVKMVQRDECWVRRTEKWYGEVKEELGPCAKPQPAWVQDRHTRLVQECVAQADHRWQTKALEAFSKGQPYPEQANQEQLLQLCMGEAARAYIVENDELKTRLAEAKAERAQLEGALAQNEAHLRNNNDKLTEYLGEAAQKPPGMATATATASSDGKASTENSSKSKESQQPAAVAPAITWVSTNGQSPIACGQQPMVDQAEGSKTSSAPDSANGSRKVARKKKTSTGSGPMCAPGKPVSEQQMAPTEVAKVLSQDAVKPANEPTFEGPAQAPTK